MYLPERRGGKKCVGLRVNAEKEDAGAAFNHALNEFIILFIGDSRAGTLADDSLWAMRRGDACREAAQIRSNGIWNSIKNWRRKFSIILRDSSGWLRTANKFAYICHIRICMRMPVCECVYGGDYVRTQNAILIFNSICG